MACRKKFVNRIPSWKLKKPAGIYYSHIKQSVVRRATAAVLALAVLIPLGACIPFLAERTSQPDMQSVQTASAQTVVAQFTIEAGEIAIAGLTQTAVPPTSTPLPPTQPPLPTEASLPTATLLPTPTSPPPTSEATPVPCDWAGLVQDITVPPNSSYPVGAQFVKTWRMQNIGSCTWTSAYDLVFYSGQPMGSITAFSLYSQVVPGQMVDISANLTAPANPGYYQGSWMLRNASGQTFGTGIGASGPLLVQIQAVQPIAPSNYVYDFASNYCAAMWQSENGALACSGSVSDPGGAVILVANPYLETGRVNGYALLTRPNNQVNGWISGYYPYFMVNTNDHFIAVVGCLRDSPGCDLTFQLDIRISSQRIQNLGGWREVYDGRTTSIDVDLSSLAGQQVQFILTVTNNGNPTSANAFWLFPSIQNLAPSRASFFTWTREGGRSNQCDELHLFLTSRRTGEAHAFSCLQGERELGMASLNADQVNLLLGWERLFKDFNSEIYRASPNQPLISRINFTGQGNNDATDSDIQAMNDFAAEIFDSIVGLR